MAKLGKSENRILEWAFSWLQERLPSSWVLESPLDQEGNPGNVLQLHGGNSFASILIQEKSSLTPRQAESLVSGFAPGLRSMNPGAALMVLAPWLSERTRDILAAQKINYMDMTGNVLIRLDNPALYIEATGAARNPEPSPRGRAQARGPKAARLIRVLMETSPPYGVGHLAEATGLAPGYVSRLLDALDAEALIDRPPRGLVQRVEVEGVLRRWARSYDVFETNRAEAFVSPTGIEDALGALTGDPPEEMRVALTGSLAAVRLAPIAAPAMLLAYCDRPEDLARELKLLPASEGGDVVLLKPFDPIVWWNTVPAESGLTFVAPTQVAVDCLTGNGRMPSEGEAVLAWMGENEQGWRRPSLPAPGELER